jgi:hypothetical protein
MKVTDTEYAVDPLFKKTSAEFDEGGADGLLLNNLASAADGRIILDSSDGRANTVAAPSPVPAAGRINLGRLRGACDCPTHVAPVAHRRCAPPGSLLCAC